jgi:VanZ family protein
VSGAARLADLEQSLRTAHTRTQLSEQRAGADLVNGDRAHTENGLARSITVDKRQPMRASLVMTSLRILTWCCVIFLAVLSLLPAQQMVRTGLPGRLEHFVAYAGSAAIAMAGYGVSRGSWQIISGFWVYAGILEYLQHFSRGRHPSIADFAASALGALCGGLAIALLWRRLSV